MTEPHEDNKLKLVFLIECGMRTRKSIEAFIS